MKKSVLSLVIVVLLWGLTACSNKEITYSAADKIVEAEGFCNTGYTSIIETEKGYYYNLGFSKNGDSTDPYAKNRMYLRYYDKETKTSVMLCNKPECDHEDPETCVAIYKNLLVFNTMLYEDALYVYGAEEDETILRIALYKVSLDGSAIDRVGVAFETENTLGEDYIIKVPVNNEFPNSYDEQLCGVIYQGEAYLPYWVQLGVASKGFMGGGMVRMNLKNGSVKQIYTTETKQEGVPFYIKPCGNYIYFKTQFVGVKKYYRYSIAEEKLKPIESIESEENLSTYQPFDVVAGDKVYKLITGENQSPELQVSSEQTGIIEKRVVLSIDPNEVYDVYAINGVYNRCSVMSYDNMLVIRSNHALHFVSIEDDAFGTILAEIEAPEYNQYVIGDTYFYKIKNGKLYQIQRQGMASHTKQGTYSHFTIYSCDIADILAGNISWEKVF